MFSWKFIIDADFNSEVIADYESEGSIKSVDNNMTITTIMTMMKMLKMSVAVSDSDSLIGKASKKKSTFFRK